MNLTGAAMNPAAGGPVGGGMMMMNNNNNGSSPAVPASSERNPEQIKIMLNTYVYEYFLKLRYYDIARALWKDEKFEFRTSPKQSPGHRKDGEINGVDGDPMETDQKDDIPDDLPRPGAGADSLMQGNGFLFEWFSVFSDLFAAHRNSHKNSNPTPATQYLMQHQQLQRMRESQQNASLRGPPGMMNPNLMGRNGQMRPGMVNGDGKIQTRLTPQQLAAIQQNNKAQQMQQMQLRGDQPEGDPNARPATPAEGDNGGSPSKRVRLDNQQQFNPAMMQNGRPGVPNAVQQSMMIQSGFNPAAMNQAQFRQNGGMATKPMAANMTNGMMSMPNSGSPMMTPMGQFPDSSTMENMYRGMNQPGMQAPGGQSGNHALQDYQMQLMLLEQQNKKRLMMARQEHESTNPRDGQPMAGGVNMQPPGMSPSGRSGTSPNPTEQMKRTPQIGGMPGSPSAGEIQTRSPAPVTFMNGMPGPDFGQTMFTKEAAMMGPGGPNMRPTSAAEMNAMNRQQQQQQAQAQQGRMPFPNGQPMQQQPSQGPPPVGTPGQREMPPPQAPPASGSAQRNNQPPSPSNSNAPPTPSQTSKPNPKKKNNNKDGPKRPTKKNSTVNAANSEENPPATPQPSTPITAGHPGPYNSAGKGPGQNGPQPNQQPQPNAGVPPNPQQMQDPNLQDTNFGFGGPDSYPNYDFGHLDGADVLENFDFDSFLNTSNDDNAFNL